MQVFIHVYSNVFIKLFNGFLYISKKTAINKAFQCHESHDEYKNANKTCMSPYKKKLYIKVL